MNNLIDVTFNTAQAVAVLSILDQLAHGLPILEADWDSLFASAGYKLLKQREMSIERPFEEHEFKNFITTDELLARREALQATLHSWIKEIDLVATAQKALAYLPPNTPLQACIYPVIKPKTNSFVFDVENNPAIFLYLDPQVNSKQLENTLIHEMHHIGLGKAQLGIKQSEQWNALPENIRTLFMWAGLFGEGIAMLAAAGGPEIHPHLYSNAEDRQRWDRDLLNYEKDFREVETFLLDVASGTLTGNAMLEEGNRFFGIQGPWYTVGWKMATTIERKMGRPAVIEAFCDPRKLFDFYNRCADDGLPKWSERLFTEL